LSASTGSANFSISNLPNWLTVSSSSGTVTTSPTTITFTVNSNASTLAPNTYAATLAFTNTTNGQGNQTRAATLTVNAAPPGAFQVSPPVDIVSSASSCAPSLHAALPI